MKEEKTPTLGNKVSNTASVWSICEESDYLMTFPSQYHSDSVSEIIKEEVTTHDNKIQRFYSSGRREVIFPNKIRRVLWPDGYSVVYFANNDVKQVFPNHEKIVYFFAKLGTTQTTYLNGV